MAWGQGRNSQLTRQARRTIPYRCHCGATTHLQLDHIINLAEGGADDITNVQWLCDPCHTAKTERERQRGITRAITKRGGMSRRLRDREPHPGTRR